MSVPPEESARSNWLNWLGWIVGVVLFAIGLATAGLTVFGKLEPQVGGTVSAVLLVLGPASTQLQRLQVLIQAQLKSRERSRLLKEKRQHELDTLTLYRKTVREAKPIDLGVSRSRKVEELERTTGRSAYVPRKEDADIRKHLRDRETLVVMVGESKAGKSRTAFEALRSTEVGLLSHVLIAPARFGLRSDTITK